MVEDESGTLSLVNNFDLIRIFAALQVVFTHALEHLQINNAFLQSLNDHVLQYFPGVPIFFVVSGFLIFWSFDRKQNSVVLFYRNRIMRLYPALWLCLLVTSLLLLFAYPFEKTDLLFSGNSLKWIAAQGTFFQFYTPDTLRFWGVGAPNGSLWTIAVELQFYILVPLLFFMLKRAAKNWTIVLFFLMLVSLLANFGIGLLVKESLAQKLGSVFILPYFYYFLSGVFLYKKWPQLSLFFNGKFIYWFLLYAIYCLVFGLFLKNDISSYWISSPFKLLADVLLMCTVLSFAFTNRTLSHRLLSGNDISYGVYIYHMLVINTFLYLGWQGESEFLFMVLGASIICGYFSWIIIEKRVLALKRKSLVH